MQVILNDHKAVYPHAYGFLMANLELRDHIFVLAEAAAIRSQETRKWIARRDELLKILELIEETFLRMSGESNG